MNVSTAAIRGVESEMERLRRENAALRNLLSDVRSEDFHGDCIYCMNTISRQGHDAECTYIGLAAAIEEHA